MELTHHRPRWWPYVAIVLIGLFLIGGAVAVALADQEELPAVELLK